MLAENDDTNGTNCQVVRPNAAIGRYYFKVRHYSHARTGAYQVRVDF